MIFPIMSFLMFFTTFASYEGFSRQATYGIFTTAHWYSMSRASKSASLNTIESFSLHEKSRQEEKSNKAGTIFKHFMMFTKKKIFSLE